MDELAPRGDDDQRVEEAVGDNLRPACLALGNDVGLVVTRQGGKPFRLGPGDVDEQVACRGDVWDVEDLVRESGERALGQSDSLTGMLMPMMETAA